MSLGSRSFQRTVPNSVLTRVLGVTWGLAMGSVAIGSFVTPAILSLIGLRTAFLVVGAILGFIGIKDIAIVRAEGLAYGPEQREAAMRAALASVAASAAGFVPAKAA